MLQALTEAQTRRRRRAASGGCRAPSAEPPPRTFLPPTVQVPDDVGRQLTLLEGMLVPIAKLARGHLQEGDGYVRAMQVWTQISEALELLRTIRPLP